MPPRVAAHGAAPLGYHQAMLVRALCWSVCATPLLAQGETTPTVEELDKARPAVVRLLAERLSQASDGRGADGSALVLAAAFEAEDRAVRYLLWREAVELAEQRGDAWSALQRERALASDFGVDIAASGVALLQRMAAADAAPVRSADVAMAALYAAGDHASDGPEREMLAFFDVAVRAALRADYAPLHDYVRSQLEPLRAPRAVTAGLPGGLQGSPWSTQQVVDGLLLGEVRLLEPFSLRQLEPLFVDLGDLAPARRADTLTATELTALAAKARHPAMRRGLQRCALQWLIRGYHAAAPLARRSIARQIVPACRALCDADGVTRYTFHDPADRDAFAFANGRWRVEAGELRGAAEGANNFATSRVPFASMDAVVIRGGIRSEDGLNFRCKVGDANLLLNWEVEDQNHLWWNGACHRTSPRVLTQGREHTIVIFSDGARCHCCVDDQHLYTVPGSLAGTVSVYPALGSEIFVRELLVSGLPGGLCDAPKGVLM